MFLKYIKSVDRWISRLQTCEMFFYFDKKLFLFFRLICSSLFFRYLYRATKDPFLLSLGEDMLNSIEFSARTDCGYATVKDVRTHKLEDRMESFFLAETTKYLYLLFDTENFIHNPGTSAKLLKTAHGQCVIDAGELFFDGIFFRG